MQTKAQHYGVAKFGGTSVATYAAMVRCVKILSTHPNVRVVVVSAPAGVTNLLVRLAEISLNGGELITILIEIKIIINAILLSLAEESISILQQQIATMFIDLENLAKKLSKQYNQQLMDELLSYGERFSARLFTAVLLEHRFQAVYQDARALIKTDNNFAKAKVLMNETSECVTKLLLPQCSNHIVVTEGFIGSTVQNITTTLGRGGSDYSAALLAEALHADLLQIWTDVPGIYTVDPRLVEHAKPIANLSFTEAAELATFGAKVLHPATLWPAIRKNIPVFVGSSMLSDAQGTWIRAKCPEHVEEPMLCAIALRRDQSLLTVSSLEMLQTHGFLAKIFSILAHHQLSVDLVTTSEVSVALTLNHSDKTGSSDLLTDEILSELQAIGNVSLNIDKNLSLIALVGNRLHLAAGLSGKVFSALSQFNIRLICHGASAHNLCFLVDDCDAKPIIQILHQIFFATLPTLEKVLIS